MARAKAEGTIYQSFDWAMACATGLTGRIELCILTARDEGRLVAIAPLMIDRRLGLPTLVWLGGHMAIYGDVLAEGSVDLDSWLSRAFAELTCSGEVACIMLDQVRSDACVAPFLARHGREVGRKRAPWIDLATAGSFSDWKSRQSRSTRRGRARRLKQLEAAGRLSFDFRPVRLDGNEEVSSLLSMKRAWAESRNVLSRTIWDHGFEAMLRALVSRASGLDVRVSTLSLDGRLIAVEIGFVSSETYISYLGAYDPSFDAYSPGLLQLEQTICACMDEGLKVFDLQPPDDAYKQSLACAVTDVVSYALPLTTIGHLQSIMARADPVGVARRAVDRMPASCRHAASSAMRSISQRVSGRPSLASIPPIFRVVRRAILLLSASSAVAIAIAD